MAEAIGIVLGVAGLAGLFNACMEATSLFYASQSHGRDFEIIMIKLEIEKTLFLQWAERVGILHVGSNDPGYDNRLNNPRIHSAVANALSGILHLLTDAERLRSDYGVISSSSTPDIAEGTTITDSHRIGTFANAYRQLQNRMRVRQGGVGHRLRTRWSIRDRERFSFLVNELRTFVQSLNNLLPASEQHQSLLVQSGIESIAQDFRSLRLVQEASRTDHPDWSEAASVRADASETGIEDLQGIDDWRRNIPELPQTDRNDMYRPEQAVLIQAADPEAFRTTATGPTEDLIYLCESGLISGTAIDSSGRSLLRYALNGLCVENARTLLRNGSDANSLEPLFPPFKDNTQASHISFVMIEQESSDPWHAERAHRISQAVELQGLLLQYGADPSRPCNGGNLHGVNMFDSSVCGGQLQHLLPYYLSKCPSIDFERICEMKGYTRLQWACSSLYDPDAFKVSAIRSLINRGANVRACCDAFGNSTLHLALLSARDEVGIKGEMWVGNSRDLRMILRNLLENRADITMRNHAGLTASDIAIGLKCAKSWNNAMQDCGLTGHTIVAPCSSNLFGQDVSKQQRFEKWREDCDHFNSWGCRPDTCTEQGLCAWWEQYWTEWLPYWRWDLKYEEWEEL